MKYTVPDATSFTFPYLYPRGTWTFLIQASTVNTVSTIFAQTDRKTFYFISAKPCEGKGNIKRGDAEGTHVGMGQQWTFTYSLMDDSLVTMAIYSTSTYS
ncbi:MAG: hypothetical protein HY747_01465, partial [Elusimicrobia bacterium]|nr:hypothetical protein [Elusimicrobiota bacterium]